MRRWLAVGVAIGGAALTIAAQQPVFRAGAEAVEVDVAVAQDGRAATGLEAADFEVRDSGVVQRVDSVSAESLPSDMSIALDVSESVRRRSGALEAIAGAATTALTTGDRWRLITFGDRPTLALPWTAADGAADLTTVRPGVGTALYDALIEALVYTAPPGRRHLVVALTDGSDDASVSAVDQIEPMAARSSALMYVALVPGVGLTPRTTAALEEAAGLTGGVAFPPESFTSAQGAVTDAIEDFHDHYVLRYRPGGVARSGWHDVTVTVPRCSGCTVRARKGYVGGPAT